MKKVLITGGSGFLGQNLAYALRDNYHVVLASRNEKNLAEAGASCNVQTYPLDVANSPSVDEAFTRIKPDIVIHGAATKYVDLAEKFPNECIDSNIRGSQNIARSSIQHYVETVIGISTDKVTSPISNIYGMSKAVMERLFVLQNAISETNFVAVRYGNVAWSTGSVFPVWHQMSLRDRHLISTGPHMYRFFFSIKEAVRLVQIAINNHEVLSGKVLSLPMKGAKMSRILDLWCKEYEVDWELGIARPGDREFELLIGENEISQTKKLEIDGFEYFLLETTSNRKFHDLTTSYNSKDSEQLTDDELLSFIREKPDFYKQKS